jgi:hypothetical protein
MRHGVEAAAGVELTRGPTVEAGGEASGQSPAAGEERGRKGELAAPHGGGGRRGEESARESIARSGPRRVAQAGGGTHGSVSEVWQIEGAPWARLANLFFLLIST